ncbi:MAG: nucleotidyltransferase family protein [Burkholderiales bacterium]|nr:nucleotidyltransferase family protein [Burkholderiales bacterium]
MILAAGRGERMRPLTDLCPKPLLEVRGKPLIQYHLEALGRAGLRELVVNTGWLGDMIESRFGMHPAWGTPHDPMLTIHYSHESMNAGGPYETAGGVARALPLLADAFWLVGGDVHVPQFAFSLPRLREFAAGGALAHLWLVENPAQHPKGDFGIDAGGRALSHAGEQFTYSTIGLYRKAFFAGVPEGNPQGLKIPLAPLLRAAMDRGEVTAEFYSGPWADVGTPERLAQLNGG